MEKNASATHIFDWNLLLNRTIFRMTQRTNEENARQRQKCRIVSNVESFPMFGIWIIMTLHIYLWQNIYYYIFSLPEMIVLCGTRVIRYQFIIGNILNRLSFSLLNCARVSGVSWHYSAFFFVFFFRFCKLASEGDRKRRRRVKSCAITTLSPLSPTNTQKCVRWNFFDWFLNAVSFSAIIEWVNLSNILMSIEIKWRFLIREREKRLRQIILLNDMIIYQFCSIIITNQTIKIKYLTQLNS